MKGDLLNEQEDFPIHRVGMLNWILAGIFSGIAWLYYPLFIAKGVLLGSLLANISYLVLKRDLKNFLQGKLLLSGKVQMAKNKFYFKHYVKLAVLAIILYFLVSGHIAHPLGLLIGLSVVVISITITTLSAVKKFFFKASEA